MSCDSKPDKWGDIWHFAGIHSSTTGPILCDCSVEVIQNLRSRIVELESENMELIQLRGPLEVLFEIERKLGAEGLDCLDRIDDLIAERDRWRDEAAIQPCHRPGGYQMPDCNCQPCTARMEKAK